MLRQKRKQEFDFEEHQPGKGKRNKENIPPESSSKIQFGFKQTTVVKNVNPKPGSSNEGGGLSTKSKSIEINPTPGSSKDGGCYFDRVAVKDMKPKLPYVSF